MTDRPSPLPDPIDFVTYQREALTTARYPRQLDNILYPTLGLAGEAGEVANKIKKLMRDDPNWGSPDPDTDDFDTPYTMTLTPDQRQSIADELGDVLWYLAVLASECGLPLHEIAHNNLVKLRRRTANNTIAGSGDNR